jgi:hypothetical protein
MKVIDTPRTGKIGNQVAYLSPYGQCFHAYVIPRNPRTEAQSRMRDIFGSSSSGWGVHLTEPQRQRWAVAAQTAPSHPSLGQYSHLSGQQLCVKINSTLRCVGQPPVDEPPAPVVFSPSPVGQLEVVNDPETGVRLLLNVGTVTEDIMLFGQAPCSRGRMKHRRVCYLGLVGLAVNGRCDVTAQYTARFGQPRPGQKIFLVTCQEKNGWKAQDQVTSAIFPSVPPPGEQQGNEAQPVEVAAVTEARPTGQAPIVGHSPLSRLMYKGSTPDAPGMHTSFKRVHPVSFLCTPLVHGARLALARLGTWALPWVGA